MNAVSSNNSSRTLPAPATRPALDFKPNVEALAQRIRRRAYEIYVSRGGGPGDALTDWARAEREVWAQLQSPAKPRAAQSQDTEALERHLKLRGEVLLHDTID